jgi:hypothetical protein
MRAERAAAIQVEGHGYQDDVSGLVFEPPLTIPAQLEAKILALGMRVDFPHDGPMSSSSTPAPKQAPGPRPRRRRRTARSCRSRRHAPQTASVLVTAESMGKHHAPLAGREHVRYFVSLCPLASSQRNFPPEQRLAAVRFDRPDRD